MPKESTELLAFYNVENLFPPDAPPIHRLDPTASGLRLWNSARYEAKIRKLAHVFTLIKDEFGTLPMLIGISEVSSRKPLADLLAQPAFNGNFEAAHFDSLDERGVDVALLYDTSKITLISAEPLTYFFEIKDDNPANYDTTRDILFCKVKFKEHLLNVFVLHLPSKRSDNVNLPKRKYMLQDLQRRCLELREQGEAVFICGDFNENPDEEYIKNFIFGPQNEPLVKNPFLPLFEQGVFSTYHRQYGLLFDQMLLSEEFYNSGFPLQFREAEVFSPPQIASWDRKFMGRPFRTYAGTRYLGGYSDHFPILVRCISE